MKYYAAVVKDEEVPPCVALPPYRILCSYWYFRNSKTELIKRYLASGYEVFIDCGAFSAESKKVTINVDDYSKYLIEVDAKIYAGLDVMGDPIATMKNVDYMEKEYGLHPIPTFHMGGKPDELRQLYKYPYIALGGMVAKSGRDEYCDMIWSMLLKEAPGIRVHGFGMTNTEIMSRYPWYSVDSSTFKDGRRFGRPKLLWNDMTMKQITEDEFKALILKMGYRVDYDAPNAYEYRHICDFLGVQAYKIYGDHLSVLNKTKNFDYLTGQQNMFDL